MSRISNKYCPKCDVILIEVNNGIDHNGRFMRNYYPKEELEIIRGKRYHEYRFFCKKCKDEWIYFSKPHFRCIERIPKNSQFRYCEERKVLLLRAKALKECKKILN